MHFSAFCKYRGARWGYLVLIPTSTDMPGTSLLPRVTWCHKVSRVKELFGYHAIDGALYLL